MSEIWKSIPSWPGYEASSEGRIRLVVQRRSKMPRILRGSKWNTGYRGVQTTFNGKYVTGMVHRLVCEAFHGPQPPGKPMVLHGDGEKRNNKPDNLRWGTGKENAEDTRRHGRMLLGTANATSKINDYDVIAIFVLASRGLTGREIGELFGINATAVNRIITRKQWAHVEVPLALITAATLRNKLHRGACQTFMGKIPEALHLFGEKAS